MNNFLPVETAGENALAENVSLHGSHNLIARGVRTQIQLGIQREQLKRVVMIRTCRTRARSHETDFPARVRDLNRAVGQLRIG